MNIVFDKGQNKYIYGEEIPRDCNKYYAEAFIKYFNVFREVFDQALNKSEFSLLLTIFGVKGIEDAGWNTYESSIKIINSIVIHNQSIKDCLTQINLHLWIYGHIMEASEPYENIMNLIDIINGEQYSILKFPPKKSGAPQSPGEKIQKIVTKAESLGIASITNVYSELWDRNLRNAIFHSDYTIYGNEVRIRSPFKSYTHEEINKLVNCAYAYFQVIDSLRKLFISQYQDPKIIDVHPEFRSYKNEKAAVIVRKGYGAIGIKDNWTIDELASGKIPYRIGRFYPEEVAALDSNPILKMLPKRD